MPDSKPYKYTVGLALSGGGSRAAAFHRGTLKALDEIKLSDQTLAGAVDIVSTVSGGSLFGAAWIAAQQDGLDNAKFLKNMRTELARGFIGRSMGLRAAKLLLPGYNRSDLIAETFNHTFFNGKSIQDQPDKPRLVLNTTVLNNGQVGKFSKDGFSVNGLCKNHRIPHHVEPMPDFPMALAVVASAAFPIGLPPLRLKRKLFDQATTLERDYSQRESTHEGRSRLSKGLSLTDGGVLENLGIQTLLKSHRFSALHLIVSDAGTRDEGWLPKWYGSMKSIGLGFLGGSILDRVMLIMNSKQNRWARQQVIEELHLSWLGNAVMSQEASKAITKLIGGGHRMPRRKALFVRINSQWSKFVGFIPDHQFIALAHGEEIEIPRRDQISEREQLLEDLGVNLDTARSYYAKLGGDHGANATNGVRTSFSGLTARELDQLENHAAWQVHAANAIYKFSDLPELS